MNRTTEAKHTPGPWRIGGSLISAQEGRAIALMLRQPAILGGKRHATRDTDSLACETGVEVDANARLIAAAPDLLEAAKDYLSPGGNQRLKRAALVAAIAKAEGR